MATELMRQAIEKMLTLPEQDQDLFAARIIEEVEDELRWNESFARPESQAWLKHMAAKVLADHEAGLTLPIDCDSPPFNE